MSFSEHMICFMYVFHYSKMLSEENDSILLGPIIYPCSENWHNKSPNVNKIEGGSPTPTNIYCTNGKTNTKWKWKWQSFIMHRLFKWSEVNKNICNLLIRSYFNGVALHTVYCHCVRNGMEVVWPPSNRCRRWIA